MELSIKLDLTDEQYEEFKKSSEDAVNKLLKDPGFGNTISTLVLQAIKDYLESPTGREMIRVTLTGDTSYYSRSNQLDSKFAKFLIEKASDDFAAEFNEPFRQIYIEVLKDEEFVKNIMLTVLYRNLNAALTKSVAGDMQTLYETSNMIAMRITNLREALNKATGQELTI